MLKFLALFLSYLIVFTANAQKTSRLSKKDWVDSVFNTLSGDEKIGQLVVVRMSTIDSKTGKVTFFEDKVAEAIRTYKVGGICLFQGGPAKQAAMLNRLQEISALPTLVSIDAETGVGMRMDSVRPLPRQMMLGAVDDPNTIFEYGRWVGKQCRRVGIHMNYAPVVDVNNNPDNPVINDRSFGENKNRVAEYGIMYMKGMQKEGVLTCAKHFPGHGDVAVDSHLDLPVITKSRSQLDSLELYPFRKLIEAGVDAVMVGHLSIPVIDNTTNRASSISYNNITKLLKQELGYGGMIFTDALEMKGVTKYFPNGEISREAIIAGNDILCLPEDIPSTLEKIKKAIKKKKIRWSQIDESVIKLLNAKYDQGLSNWKPVELTGIADDLNRESDYIRRKVADHAITLLKHNDNQAFPLLPGTKKKVAYIGLGITADNVFAKRMRAEYNADVFYFDYKQDSLRLVSLVPLLQERYDVVIVGVHQIRRFPANNFGISKAAVNLVNSLQGKVSNTVFVFGNPYAIKNFAASPNIIACYEDEKIIQETAADILSGQKICMGSLPVSVAPDFVVGAGLKNPSLASFSPVVADVNYLQVIDSLANDAIKQKATPGMVVLIAKDGKIAYHKAHGYYTYDSVEKVSPESIYDLASVTKICATTISIMKLYDEGRLQLDDKIGKYIYWLKGTDKENITIRNILLHQAGLKSYIQFYRETIDTVKLRPLEGMYSRIPGPGYSIRVADSMFMKNSFRDTMYKRIATSPLSLPAKMVYSDNDFIFLGLIVESISGMSLHDYTRKNFFEPMGLVTAGFKPRERFAPFRLVPTEDDKYFRNQLIRGDVHDEGAAMFGGVSGHAGLFANAYDVAMIMQMLLNKGMFNGRRYLSDTTITRFTAYNSDISHRALGFDKPFKDNAKRSEPYPAASASPATFGHTGFTGIGVWADPVNNLVFIILSNRVYPNRGNKFGQLNVRPNMHEAAYRKLVN